jgi:hypothetical protein
VRLTGAAYLEQKYTFVHLKKVSGGDAWKIISDALQREGVINNNAVKPVSDSSVGSHENEAIRRIDHELRSVALSFRSFYPRTNGAIARHKTLQNSVQYMRQRLIFTESMKHPGSILQST